MNTQHGDWMRDAIYELLRYTACAWPVLLGASILASGPERFSAPSWDAIKAIAPMYAWGSSLIVLGVLTMARWFTPRLLGYAGTACWTWIWVALFVYNASQVPASAYTGIPTYGCIAVVYTGFAVATWMHDGPRA